VQVGLALNERVDVPFGGANSRPAPKRRKAQCGHRQGAARLRRGDRGLAATRATEEAFVHKIEDFVRA
jgi:hypothetical protein